MIRIFIQYCILFLFQYLWLLNFLNYTFFLKYKYNLINEYFKSLNANNIFGNAELRIKSWENHIFSNFGIMGAYFNNKGKKVNDFLGEENER